MIEAETRAEFKQITSLGDKVRTYYSRAYAKLVGGIGSTARNVALWAAADALQFYFLNLPGSSNKEDES